MKKFDKFENFENVKKWSFALGILAFVLGLLILIFPTFWIRLIISVLGIGAVGYGIYNLKFSKNIIEDEKYSKTIKIKSIVSIVAGVIAFLFPIAFGEAAWTAMTVLLIIYLIGAASIGFYTVSLLKQAEVECKHYIIENFILLGLAVVLILISPKNFGTALVRFVGIVAMIAGAGLVVYQYIEKKRANEEENSSDVGDSDDVGDSESSSE